ncbi:MAG: hypothetical protein HLX50_12790 [Alteromonadaceae bacterium]|nr:hypothetical protein [Alteromonadaceae bacterium]
MDLIAVEVKEDEFAVASREVVVPLFTIHDDDGILSSRKVPPVIKSEGEFTIFN